MKLILTQGYPYPYPAAALADEAMQERLTNEACVHRLELDHVVAFEQKYTTTVQFADTEDAQDAKRITGWAWWGNDLTILEVPTSDDDGFDYAALIVPRQERCYCGHMLVDDAEEVDAKFHLRSLPAQAGSERVEATRLGYSATYVALSLPGSVVFQVLPSGHREPAHVRLLPSGPALLLGPHGLLDTIHDTLGDDAAVGP